MSDKRIFVAVPLPQAVKDQLAEQCRALKKTYAFRRWVHPSDLHLTLKFLGEVPERQLEAVRHALRKPVAAPTPFAIKLEQLGTFGKSNNPSVLWMGVRDEECRLPPVQEQVETVLAEGGFPKENKAFRPHLTLARQYNGQEPFRQISHSSADLPVYEIPVDRYTLYESRLGEKPMYHVVDEFIWQA